MKDLFETIWNAPKEEVASVSAVVVEGLFNLWILYVLGSIVGFIIVFIVMNWVFNRELKKSRDGFF